MRIVAEWYALSSRDSTCMQHYCEAFEGETVAEIDAAIRARVGDAPTMIVGLRNTRENFEIYTGMSIAPGQVFADTEFADPQPLAPEGWFARLAQRVLRRFGL